MKILHIAAYAAFYQHPVLTHSIQQQSIATRDWAQQNLLASDLQDLTEETSCLYFHIDVQIQ